MKLETVSWIHPEKRKCCQEGDDFTILEFSLARYSITDLTRLQTSALFQDINFHVAAIFNSSTDGAQREGVGEHEAWMKAEKAFCKPEWQWMRGRELRANEELT